MVARLLSVWPNATDVSKEYIGGIAAVLREYPRIVAYRCCDPVHGLARECKFPRPLISDVAAWCDRERAGMYRIIDRDDLDRRTIEGRRGKEMLSADERRAEVAAVLKKYWPAGQTPAGEPKKTWQPPTDLTASPSLKAAE